MYFPFNCKTFIDNLKNCWERVKKRKIIILCGETSVFSNLKVL